MIDILIQLYTNNSVLINLISILFGIAGTIIGIITWRDSTKTNKSYQYLFELAEKNIDKSVTDQQLLDKKKEIEIVSQRVEALQEQIRKEIPTEAKRTVLRDKLNSEIELLNQHFESTKRIQNELAKIGESSEIPPDLLRSIEEEISPEYIFKEKREKARNILIIVTSGSAIASTILPYPMGSWISWFLLLLAVPFLLILVKYSYSKTQINKSIDFFLFGFGLTSFFISLVIGLSRIYFDNINEEGSFLSMLLFIGLWLFSFCYLLWRKIFKYKLIS